MKIMYKVNDKGLKLIKEFEGCYLKAYYCPAKVLTIGYGHTDMAGLPKVHKGMTITKEEAHDILVNDLVKYENGVKDALGDSLRYLNENQFSACVSLCFNIGIAGFKRSSVARYIKVGRLEVAANKFKLWNKGGGRVLRGLVRRRAAETELFLS